MTEALNRHLPERPRLRVPQHPRRAARRPLCRPNLGATLKPASLPFEALKVMSEHPELFRRFLAMLAVLLPLNFGESLRAAETTAPAPAAEAKPAPAPAPTNAAPAAVPAAPASTNAVSASPAAAAPSSDSDRRDRDRDRGPSPSGGSSSRTATAPTNAPPGSYESFRLIAERNIFDQNRSPRVSRSSGGSEEPKRVPKIEAFALAGTMSFSNRHMAFFTSSSSQYQKALKPGDAIAGYQVATVAVDHVKLEREGATVELKLNQQMRREDDGPWQVSARAEVASAPPSPAGGATTASPAGMSDALKRLMELRAKEQ